MPKFSPDPKDSPELKASGIAKVGEGKDSQDSELLIAAADRNDPRPVSDQFWSGRLNPTGQSGIRSMSQKSPEQTKPRKHSMASTSSGGTPRTGPGRSSA